MFCHGNVQQIEIHLVGMYLLTYTTLSVSLVKVAKLRETWKHLILRLHVWDSKDRMATEEFTSVMWVLLWN